MNKNSRYKNIIIIVVINILIIFALFIIVDYCFAVIKYKKFVNSFHENLKRRGTYSQEEYNSPPLYFNYSWKLYHFRKIYQDSKKEINTLRRVVRAKDSTKKSVIVFGCSFAEGSRINDDETFEYQLSKRLNRTVYNRGYGGFGISEALWLTKQNEFYKDIDIEPDYVIYIYIADHLRRLYADKYGFDKNVYLSFENKNGVLAEKNPRDFWLAKFYLFKNYKEQNISNDIYSAKNNDKHFNEIKLYFEKTRSEIRKRYPNTKFIIIKHPSFVPNEENSYKDMPAVYYCYYTPRWKELEEEGFIIYDLKTRIKEDLRGNRYTVFDGHSNAKAWEIVINNLLKDKIIN